MSSQLFTTVIFEEKVAIKPSELHLDSDELLLTKVKQKIEGVCNSNGYVHPGTTEILARSMGEAEHGKFTAEFIYFCKVQCKCFIPFANQIVIAKITAMNKSGAYAVIMADGSELEAARIFCPRDHHLGSDIFDQLTVDTTLKVRFGKSRFQVNDPFISVIGVLAE
jgi:DNA-directed RNA polymerase subunit E'/Rpb7